MKSSKKNTDDVLASLRSYAKYRILTDMLESAKRHARFSKDYQILIMDKSALRVFSSCCKFFDVYQANVFHIERLEVKRKRFPKSDAIYFISPTPSSINRLIQDFQEDMDPKKVQYGGVHLAFTSHVSEDLIKLISQTKNLTPRIYSFNEINLDFYLYNDNVFHFQKKQLIPVFKIVDENDRGVDIPIMKSIFDELAHRLFTVCAIFMEFPYVQYQGDSVIAKSLAKKVNDNLKTFYEKTRNIKIREPRGTILILDRGFDLIAPVVHDYFYESIVYDFQNIQDDGQLQINDTKTIFLNDQDELWVRFRNKHIAEVHAKLNEEVSQVASESKKKYQKNTQDMSLQEMAEVIRSMPKYEEMMKKYQVHMELINRGIVDFQENNLRKLIQLEQDIISGLDSKGTKVNNTNVVMQVSQISKNLKNQDYLRLLMIYFACYDLNKKDKDTLLKSVDNENHRHILQNLEYLNENLANGKILRRRQEELTNDQFNEYARKLSQSNYEILRTEPKICKLIKQIHDQTLDTKDYPYIDKPKQQKKVKDVRKKGASNNIGAEFDTQDILENPRIFVFVFGGLSHHEVVSIANLQETLNAQIVPGANEIITCKDYLSQLEKLHKKENDQHFIKSQQTYFSKDDKDDINDNDLEDEDTADTYAINL